MVHATSRGWYPATEMFGVHELLEKNQAESLPQSCNVSRLHTSRAST